MRCPESRPTLQRTFAKAARGALDGRTPLDTLARALQSRRTALTGLLGGLIAPIGLAPDHATAHNPNPGSSISASPGRWR